MKQNQKNDHYWRSIIVLCFLFCYTVSFAQHTQWDGEELLDESDIESNPFLTEKSGFFSSNKIFKEEPEIIGNRMDVTTSSDGVLGIGMTKSDSRQMEGGPFTLPGGPDAPIDSEILYLIAAGLAYASYTIVKINATN